jgi:wobble nucleotide-excising tRNase
MIKKIEHINSLGIFNNFSWSGVSNIEEFREKNIIYAWNYSGKTTLSRLFSSLKNKQLHCDFPTSSFKIQHETGNVDNNSMDTFPYQVEVFNSDYIKENLKWGNDENINAIAFEVGDNAKISQQIDDLKILIDKINGTDEIKGEKEPYIIDKGEFDSFENSLFTKEAKRIKDEVFLSLINFDKGAVKRIRDYIGVNLDNYIIKSKSELETFGKIILITEAKTKLDPVEFVSNYPEIITLSKELLDFVPSKSNVINILEKSNQIYEWARYGLNLHSPKNKCAFCGKDLTEERYNELLNYFNNQASALKEKAKKILNIIQDEETFVASSIVSYSPNDFNDNFQNEFKLLKLEFDKELAKYKSKLLNVKSLINKKKDKSIYQAIKIGYNENELQPLLNIISKINKLILDNNDFSNRFETIVEEKRGKYKNHLVASFLKNEKYYAKKLKAEKAQKSLDILNQKEKKYQKDISLLTLRKESVSEGCAQLEAFIQSFLSRDDIQIKPSSTESGKYNLMRGNNLAKNLSEGEKMAISFSHFLVLLQSLSKKNVLKDYIIFIDDPISSLDSNHIFQINSLLKETFFNHIADPNQPAQKMWKLKCKQLFISTHNFEFFNLLKDLPKKDGLQHRKETKNRESRYFISRNQNGASIEKLPDVYNDYQSEYQYLFSEIAKFNQNSQQNISSELFLMPNILRRFVEMYTLTKYPSTDEVDTRADKIFGTEKSKRILKPLHYFSHFNNIDRISKQSEFLVDIGSACKELLKHIKTKDKLHFEALQSIL